MARIQGNGDKLARGAVRASFLTNESNNITQDRWNKAFDDFDPEAFQEKESASRVKIEGAPKETSRSRL